MPYVIWVREELRAMPAGTYTAVGLAKLLGISESWAVREAAERMQNAGERARVERRDKKTDRLVGITLL